MVLCIPHAPWVWAGVPLDLWDVERAGVTSTAVKATVVSGAQEMQQPCNLRVSGFWLRGLRRDLASQSLNGLRRRLEGVVGQVLIEPSIEPQRPIEPDAPPGLRDKGFSGTVTIWHQVCLDASLDHAQEEQVFRWAL